jgi:glyoxylase-like metal-dependent hydrolase (beta-lactamase superfamily II)
VFERIVGPIHFLESMSFDSNIIYIDGGDHHVLIDTGTGLNAQKLDQNLRRLGTSAEKITDVVLTHSHIDHMGGLFPILASASPRIHLHREEADRINSGDMEVTLADTVGAELPPIRIDHPLEEGQTLDFGDVSLQVYHTPGHSIGSICLYAKDLGLLITGDTMFPEGSFGRVDLPTGDLSKLVQSLRRISQIDFDIALPGHMHAIIEDAKSSAQLSFEMARTLFRS